MATVQTSNKRLASDKSQPLMGAGCIMCMETLNLKNASNKRLLPIAARSKAYLKFIAARALIRSFTVFVFPLARIFRWPSRMA